MFLSYDPPKNLTIATAQYAFDCLRMNLFLELNRLLFAPDPSVRVRSRFGVKSTITSPSRVSNPATFR